MQRIEKKNVLSEEYKINFFFLLFDKSMDIKSTTYKT